MELLERYLQAMRGYLLRWRRDDIIKELGDNILSQMEDRAAELGRPLTEAEQEEILKQHGHPVVAATRFQRMPMRQLIGPELFPLYWFSLLAMLGMVVVFCFALFLVLAANGNAPLEALVRAWSTGWVFTLGAVGALTIAFGLMEYFGKGRIPFTDQFNPKELPPLKTSAPPRANSVVELILGGMFIFSWLIFLHSATPAIARELPFRLAPVWWRFEIPMLATISLGMAAAYAHLFRPQVPWLRPVLRLASDVVGVVTFYVFLSVKEFILINPGGLERLSNPIYLGKHVWTAAQVTNYALALGPAIAFVVFLFDGLFEVDRLIRRKRPAAFTFESHSIL
jgi:hypothetical protein